MDDASVLPTGYMRLPMKAAWEEVLTVSWGGIGQPVADCRSGLFGYFELDRSASFPLDYRGPVLYPAADAYVVHPELHEIATPQLAVDSEIEQSEVPFALFKLKPDANCPDLPWSQRTFLTDKAAFVPGSFAKADKRWGHAVHGWLLEPDPRPPQRGVTC
jgi:hypothetical protein